MIQNNEPEKIKQDEMFSKGLNRVDYIVSAISLIGIDIIGCLIYSCE